MAITREELARRLKAARENCGLTQQEVADTLGIQRASVAHIEMGRRAVNSLELEKLARLFGRGIGELVSEGAFTDDPIAVLFRATPGIAEMAGIEKELHHCANLCRETTRLEGILGYTQARGLPATYSLPAPSTRWDAISQGILVASQERNRLGLGSAPIRNIPELIRQQGVRVTEASLPDDISSLFFHGRDIGLGIVANRNHVWQRRFFSYTHEYCHVLADRERPGVVSRAADSDQLIEVRANVFAAHFLMPEAGIRSFLQTIGKGEATRKTQEIFNGEKPLSAQKRMAPGSQTIHSLHVAQIAWHFGVSYEAALYQLLNLGLITRDEMDDLRSRSKAEEAVTRALNTPGNAPEDIHYSLSDQVLRLGLEAYDREEISRNKLLELADEADYPRDRLEELLGKVGRNRKHGGVDENILQEIVRRIVEVAAPEKIILFGSAAKGEMGPDSDVDLMVVKSGTDEHELAGRLYMELAGVGVAKDILVVRPETLEEYKDDIGFIYYQVLKEGKVIYANQ